jgi:hypothetical protein
VYCNKLKYCIKVLELKWISVYCSKIEYCIKLLELKWISVYCNKLKYSIKLLELKWISVYCNKIEYCIKLLELKRISVYCNKIECNAIKMPSITNITYLVVPLSANFLLVVAALVRFLFPYHYGSRNVRTPVGGIY